MTTVTVIIGVIIVVLGGYAISLARNSERRTTTDKSNAIVERARAKAEIEEHQRNAKLQEEEQARQRAVALANLRAEHRMEILEADRKNVQLLQSSLQDASALKVEFEDGSAPELRGIPVIRWNWRPLGNSIIRIHRNEGTILEEAESIKTNAMLIHVVQDEATGEYRDKEAASGRTYNYYAFIEAKRDGIRPKSVNRDLPPELAGMKVIDEKGMAVTQFEDIVPEEFQETIYSGLRYRRMTIEAFKTERDQKRASLDERKADLELKRYENELKTLEDEMTFESGEFDTDDLEAVLKQARRQTDNKRKVEEFMERVRKDSSLDEEEKEIIEQRLMAKLMR